MPAHILVVDDTAAMLSLYHDVLTDEAYHVTTTDGGTFDPAFVQRTAPDLVILDYLLDGDVTADQWL